MDAGHTADHHSSRGNLLLQKPDQVSIDSSAVPSLSDAHHQPRPQFGTRFLKDPSNVFEHNAWDHVIWDDLQQKMAEEKVAENSQPVLSNDMLQKYETDASQFWDRFYGIHQNRFFKDRHWLFTEFPELATSLKTTADINECLEGFSVVSSCSKKSVAVPEYPGCHSQTRILEIGCGVGNTVFPILEINKDPLLFIYCCDFSDVAVNLTKQHASCSVQRCHAFVCDVTKDVWTVPFPKCSLDFILMIFVLSAIHPERMQHVLNTAAEYLKPGGCIIFRDYGRYDMAQLRFKPGHCLGNNFYVRGDGTRVYFFLQEEVRDLFSRSGLVEELNLVDRRLQVNRGKMLKMYRVWIQAKYRKPYSPS